MNEFIIDVKNLTVFKAKSQLDSLENRRETLLEMKEKAMPLPKSKELTGMNVSGGTREDKFINYVIKIEDIDEEVNQIDVFTEILESFINKELERLNEYDEWEQKVIYMREQEHKTWIKIACSVPFSERQCRRIYKHFKGKRNIF